MPKLRITVEDETGEVKFKGTINSDSAPDTDDLADTLKSSLDADPDFDFEAETNGEAAVE